MLVGIAMLVAIGVGWLSISSQWNSVAQMIAVGYASLGLATLALVLDDLLQHRTFYGATRRLLWFGAATFTIATSIIIFDFKLETNLQENSDEATSRLSIVQSDDLVDSRQKTDSTSCPRVVLVWSEEEGLYTWLDASRRSVGTNETIEYDLWIDNWGPNTVSDISVRLPSDIIEDFERLPTTVTTSICDLALQGLRENGPTTAEWSRGAGENAEIHIDPIPAGSSALIEWTMRTKAFYHDTGRYLHMPVTILDGDTILTEETEDPYLVDHPALQNQTMLYSYRRIARNYAPGDMAPQELRLTNAGNVLFDLISINWLPSTNGQYMPSQHLVGLEYAIVRRDDLGPMRWIKTNLTEPHVLFGFPHGTRRPRLYQIGPGQTLILKWADIIPDSGFNGQVQLGDIEIDYRDADEPKRYTRHFAFDDDNKDKAIAQISVKRADNAVGPVLPGERMRYEIEIECCTEINNEPYTMMVDLPAWTEVIPGSVRYSVNGENDERRAPNNWLIGGYRIPAPEDGATTQKSLSFAFDAELVDDAPITEEMYITSRVEVTGQNGLVPARGISRIKVAPKSELQIKVLTDEIITTDGTIEYEVIITQSGLYEFQHIKLGGIFPPTFEMIDPGKIDYALRGQWERRYSASEDHAGRGGRTGLMQLKETWPTDGLELSTWSLRNGGDARVRFILRAPSENDLGSVRGPRFILYGMQEGRPEARITYTVEHEIIAGTNFLSRFDWKNIVLAELMGFVILLVIFPRFRSYVGSIGTAIIIGSLLAGGVLTIFFSMESGEVKWWMAFVAVAGVPFALILRPGKSFQSLKEYHKRFKQEAQAWWEGVRVWWTHKMPNGMKNVGRSLWGR